MDGFEGLGGGEGAEEVHGLDGAEELDCEDVLHVLEHDENITRVDDVEAKMRIPTARAESNERDK